MRWQYYNGHFAASTDRRLRQIVDAKEAFDVMSTHCNHRHIQLGTPTGMPVVQEVLYPNAACTGREESRSNAIWVKGPP